MMISLERALHGFLVVMTCFALAGCGGGEKLVTVTGKVVEDGQPLAIEEREYRTGGGVEVTFYPLDSAGNVAKQAKSYGTTAKQDGTFVMDGDQGEGIPAGKYRVALRGQSSSGYSPTAPSQGDRWGGKFDAGNSPFTFDIQENQEIVLDVSQAPAPKSESY